MQQMSATARLFAGQLSELTRLAGTMLLLKEYRKMNGVSQRLPNSNAKAGNTNIVLLFNSCVYFSNSAGTIR